MRKAVLAVLCVQAALTIGFLVALRTGVFPLGVRGEWEWLRLPPGVTPTAIQWGIGGAAVLGYAGFAALGFRWLGANSSKSSEVLAVLGLLAASVSVQFLVALAAPEGYGLAKWILSLHNPGSNGYYTVAKIEIDDPWRFLAEYPDWIRRQDALHVGTHPPGLFLIQRGLLNAMEASPASARFVVDHLPSAVSVAFPVIEQYAHLPRADRASLALTGALTLLCCASTVLPLYLLARASLPPHAAWAAAALWPLAPAANLFQPTADTAFPLLTTTALMLAAFIGQRSYWVGLILAVGSGMVMALGMEFSLVFLPIGLIVAVLIFTDGRAAFQARVAAFLATGAGFLAATFLGWAVTRSNPFATWWWNQRNHARFYVEYPRSYLAWVIANPIELVVAIGLAAAVWGLVGLFRGREAPRVSLATVGLLVVLTLSGRSLSEVARLWLPMMPALLVAAGDGLSQVGQKGMGGAISLGSTITLVGLETLLLQATIQCVYPT